VAAFDLDELSPDNLAYRLMVNSTVHLYWRRELLEQATSWFAEHGYQLVRLKADEWRDESDMHSAFVAALDFPAYYGHNLNALNDCLRDVAAFRYGATPGRWACYLFSSDTISSPGAAPGRRRQC